MMGTIYITMNRYACDEHQFIVSADTCSLWKSGPDEQVRTVEPVSVTIGGGDDEHETPKDTLRLATKQDLVELGIATTQRGTTLTPAENDLKGKKQDKIKGKKTDTSAEMDSMLNQQNIKTDMDQEMEGEEEEQNEVRRTRRRHSDSVVELRLTGTFVIVDVATRWYQSTDESRKKWKGKLLLGLRPVYEVIFPCRQSRKANHEVSEKSGKHHRVHHSPYDASQPTRYSGLHSSVRRNH
jgi:hypothetical protein